MSGKMCIKLSVRKEPAFCKTGSTLLLWISVPGLGRVCSSEELRLSLHFCRMAARKPRQSPGGSHRVLSGRESGHLLIPHVYSQQVAPGGVLLYESAGITIATDLELP